MENANMITNSQEWARAKETVRRYKNRLDYLMRRVTRHPRDIPAAEAKIECLQKRITELTEQLHEYDRLIAHSAAVPVPSKLADWGRHLIECRMAGRISQVELAASVGMHLRTIRRYESAIYSKAPYEQMIVIEAALRQLADRKRELLERADL